jgi:tetratricopeptide (TPR) repeat protein
LRAGHMDAVIAFAKARSLERLRAFDLAAESYRLAADISEDLRLAALESADVCDALYEAAQMTRALEPQDETEIETDATGDPQVIELDPDSVLAEFEARTALLDGLLPMTEGTHYEPIVREELERADIARASYFLGIRKTDVNGDVRAISELQRVTFRHPDSKNFNRHLLELADLYAELAVEYSTTYPPESLLFDPVRFQELVEGASRLYEMVASRDGTPEKLEASRRLEAFLAYSIRIDRDRFTP